MMLRTTFSRIKKVCTVAFTPRLLRDQRCAAGKYEFILYAGLRKAQKCTKATDDDEFEHKKEKHKDGCEYFIVPDRDSKVRSDKYSDEEKNLDKGNIYTSRTPISETHVEKCQRLIDRAFGKDDVDSIMGHQYYSHGVDIEETRRELDKAEMARIKFEEEKNIDKPIRDDRIQFGAFKRELIKEDPTVEPDDLIMNESILKAIARKQKKEGTIQSDNTEESIEDSSLIPRTLNVHVTTNLDPEILDKMENVQETQALKAEKNTEINTGSNIKTQNEFKENFYQRRNIDITLPLTATVGKDTSDKYVHNQESCDDWGKQHDKSTMVKTEASCLQDSSLKIDLDDSLIPNNTKWIYNYTREQEINENKLNWNIKHRKKLDQSVHATTAKEDEEQLTQKLEHIDETPLVEAQRPTIEGFNITPRVLGEMGQTCNCFYDKRMGNQQSGVSSGLDVPARFDEVAKRCLDTPANKIDEILLKEMEKLGVPVASNRDNIARSPVIEDDLVQMDVIKNQLKKPVDTNDLNLENDELERGTAELYTTNKLYPSRYLCNEKILPEHSVEKRDKENQGISEPVVRIHPNEVLIDPYDKKTLAYDMGEYDPNEKFPSHEFSYFYVPNKGKQAKEMKRITSLLEKTNITASDHLLVKERSNLKPEKHRMRGSDVSRHRGYLEHKLQVKKELPLANPIYEPYLQCTKNKVCVNDLVQAERIYCEQTIRKAEILTKKRNTISPYIPIPKLSATDGTSEEKQRDPNLSNETQYTYAKENYPTSSFDQSNMYGSYNMWNPQQYHQSQIQPTQQNYPDGQKQTPFDDRHLCLSNDAWCQTQFEPQQHVDIQHANTQQANTQHANTQHANTPQANTQRTNTQHPSTKRYNTTYSPNKTNMCVSDDIWDTEQINCEQSLNEAQINNARDVTSSFQSPNMYASDCTREQKQTDSNTAMKQALNPYANGNDNTTSFNKPINNFTDATWTKEELDPKHVLTCNETCPISPRSHMNATETSHIVGTEDIFGKDFTSTDSSLPRRDPITESVSGTPNEPEQRGSSGMKTNSVSNFIQADSVLNPLIKEQNSCPDGITANTINPLPRKKNVSLSELLKRVRNRSRIVECQSDLKQLGVEVDPAEGKCGNTKAPHCPPMAPRSPPNNPVPPPTFGLPKLKPRPRACPRRKPKTKCSSCDLDLSSGLQLGPKACERNAGSEADVKKTRSMADLTDEVIDRLQTLGKVIGGMLHQGKTEEFEAGALVTNRRGSKILLAKDYQPWAPIPSWPSTKKEHQDCDKKTRVCTPGCKVFPPTRTTHDPSCDPQPCTGFPKKTFSLLDCFTVSLGDHKVYDLGEF